jgi:hypothetical protein
MEADFSIELAQDDPVLDFPWTDPAGELSYFDLKGHPELIAKVEEAQEFREVAELLRAVNSVHSAFESAKCDAWATTELHVEEEIFAAPHKFGSYVDLVFSNVESRVSFPVHERFVRSFTELLRRAPDFNASVEVCVRRCFFGGSEEIRDGFYCTLYVSGYGEDEASARRNCGIALSLAGNAVLQLSASLL